MRPYLVSFVFLLILGLVILITRFYAGSETVEKHKPTYISVLIISLQPIFGDLIDRLFRLFNW